MTNDARSSEYQCVVEAFRSCSTSCGRDGTGAVMRSQTMPRVEREIAQETAAVEQAAYRRCFGAGSDAPQVLVGGKTYRRVLRSVGSYYTMAR